MAHVTPHYFGAGSYIGGGERHVSNKVRAVQRAGAGFAPEIVSFHRAPTTRQMLDEIPLTLVQDRGPGSRERAVGPELWEVLAGFDLIYVHHALTPIGEINLAIALQCGRPVVVTDHGAERRAPLETGALGLVDAVVCQSEFGAGLLRPWVSAPLHVLLGPVDDRLFTPDTGTARQLRLLCAGRILPHKAIDRVIRALPADLPLTVCGPAFDPAYLELLRQLARGKQVAFVTEASDGDLLHLYRSSTATILASGYRTIHGELIAYPELFGQTLGESLASGTPILAARAGGMPEVIGDSGAGRVFADDAELETALADIAARRWPPPGMAERCVARARAMGQELAGRRLTEIYRAAIASFEARR
ncbi:MAG: glycosyltransferase family 4 protein [Dongiaceae bacterium]